MIVNENVSKWFIKVGCFVGLGLLYVPLMGLLFGLIKNEGVSYQGILTSQRVDLFIKSFSMTMASSICSTIISICMSITLVFTQLGKRIEKFVVNSMLLLLLVPYPVHGLVWSRIFYNLGLSTTGDWISIFQVIWIQSMIWIPLSILIITTGFKKCDSEVFFASLIYTKSGLMRAIVFIPDLLPFTIISVLINYVMIIGDYGIPSLYGVTSYAMAIQGFYSVGGDVGQSLIMSLPIMLTTIGSWIILWKLGYRYLITSNKSMSVETVNEKSKYMFVISIIGIIAVLSPCAVFSGILLNGGAWENVGSEIVRSYESFGSAFMMAVTVAFLGYHILRSICITIKIDSLRTYFAIILTFPMALPSTISALGLLYFAQNSFWNLSGWLILIFGLASRYLPFAILIVLLYQYSLDKRLLEAGQVLLRNDYQNKKWIVWGMLKPGALVGSFVMGILSITDTGVFTLLAPPGTETIGIRLYSYLHYGANDTASAMSLIYGLTLGMIIWMALKVKSFGNGAMQND